MIADIADKVITGAATSVLVAMIFLIGNKIGWVFSCTKQNRKDLNEAFRKIRELEHELNRADND